MKISINKAVFELSVHQETLRRWEVAGKIKVERTPLGHRRYDLKGPYWSLFVPRMFGTFELIKDLGSGLNYQKRFETTH
jgi:hypothetical protein